MKTKLIIASVVAGLLVVIWLLFAANRKLKEAKDIQVSNVKELLAERAQHTALILSYKQAEAITTLKLDSLSNALKIKPRTIIKTVEKTVTLRDTVRESIPVAVLGYNFWEISDQDKCWTWKGTATLEGDALSVERVLFNYSNKTTDIYYWQRTHKCWFLKWGKKKTFVKSSAECGDSYTREIQISKK